jgi:hypothetical protein
VDQQVTGFKNNAGLMSVLPIAAIELPDSIREHQVLVGIAEWVATRYPWRMATAARVRRRLFEAA